MKLPRLNPGDAIEVIWLDSHFQEAGWKNEEDIQEAEGIQIRSVCQYISSDKEYIYTVADRSITKESPGIMRDLQIPNGCIKKIRMLR